MTKKELTELLKNRTKAAYELYEEIDTNATGGQILKAKYAAIWCELSAICEEAGIDTIY